jgi:hypothetical protein
MWLDDWSEVKLLDDDTIAQQSVARFVERNGLGALLIRAVGGLLREASYLLTSLSLFHDRVSIGAVLAGLIPLAIGLAGIRRLPAGPARTFTSLTVAGFLSALALHTPHASHPRFQLTLLPVLYATLSLEFVSWLAALSRGRQTQSSSSASPALKPEAQAREPNAEPALTLRVCVPNKVSWMAIGMGAVIAAVSLAVGQSWPQTWPPRLLDARPTTESEQLMATWLAAHLSPNDAVVLAAIDFSPYWYRKIPGSVFEYPPDSDAAAFGTWSARRNVTGVVVDARRVPRWAAAWPELAHEPRSATAGPQWVLEFESAPLRFYRRAFRPASQGLPPAGIRSRGMLPQVALKAEMKHIAHAAVLESDCGIETKVVSRRDFVTLPPPE